MDKGFTIKCNECGKETIFKNNEKKHGMIQKDNQDIQVYPDYGGEINIECRCKNEVYDS